MSCLTTLSPPPPPCPLHGGQSLRPLRRRGSVLNCFSIMTRIHSRTIHRCTSTSPWPRATYLRYYATLSHWILSSESLKLSPLSARRSDVRGVLKLRHALLVERIRIKLPLLGLLHFLLRSGELSRSHRHANRHSAPTARYSKLLLQKCDRVPPECLVRCGLLLTGPPGSRVAVKSA
jgi:hypothetical protein